MQSMELKWTAKIDRSGAEVVGRADVRRAGGIPGQWRFLPSRIFPCQNLYRRLRSGNWFGALTSGTGADTGAGLAVLSVIEAPLMAPTFCRSAGRCVPICGRS